jgi:pimeloyl-ACP methyl ester carboxylesterase
LTTASKTEQVVQLYPELALTVTRLGAGRPVLVVHAGHGPSTAAPIAEHFAADSMVLMPTHPGWHGTHRPDWFDGVDDLAIAYLHLLEDENLSDVLVVGASFGGWVASEMAVRDLGHRIGGLILIDPPGAEVPGYQVFVPPPGDPALPDSDMLKTLMTYGGPSFTDPKLLHRLGRVRIPTLVLWGENDRVVKVEVGRVHAAALADARFEVIPDTGHMAVRDNPGEVFARIDAWLNRERPASSGGTPVAEAT